MLDKRGVMLMILFICLTKEVCDAGDSICLTGEICVIREIFFCLTDERLVMQEILYA